MTEITKKAHWPTIVIAISIMIQWAVTLLAATENNAFIERTTQFSFIGLALNGFWFGLYFIFSRKKDIIKVLAYSTLSTAIFLSCIILTPGLSDVITNTTNEILIHSWFRANFIRAAINDGNVSFAIAGAAEIGFCLLVYGQWFIKRKEDYDSKVQKQVVIMGLGLYLILFPLIFIFTHFCSVGSNMQFMQNQVQFVDTIVKYYEDKNETEHFRIHHLHWFPTLQDAIAYYDQDVIKEKTIGNKNKIRFQQNVIEKLKPIIVNGWYNSTPINYDNMGRFFLNWFQVAYNFSYEGTVKATRTMWHSNWIEAEHNSYTQTDVSRHAIFYMHESKHGGYYVYFDFSRMWKDAGAHYIFNTFFILYHIFFIGLFIYLISLHGKNNLRKRKQVDSNV